ncbi:MAG: hypothetical protein Q7S98_01470 [Deltaproteobacteria bacterium]|nr:hypothetical protein [Deltaproteobacteria bacterium]
MKNSKIAGLLTVLLIVPLLIVACDGSKKEAESPPVEDSTKTAATGNVSSCPTECKPNETCLNGVCTPFVSGEEGTTPPPQEETPVAVPTLFKTLSEDIRRVTDIKIDSTNNKAYLTTFDGLMSVDLATRQVTTVVTTDKLTGLQLAPGGAYVTTDTPRNGLKYVNFETKEVTVVSGCASIGLAKGLALGPGKVYVMTNTGREDVKVCDLTAGRVTAIGASSISTPAKIALSTDNSKLYVITSEGPGGGSAGGGLKVVNLATLEVRRLLRLGQASDMVIANNKAYITTDNGNTRGLKIFDFSNNRATEIDGISRAKKIALNGNRAYILKEGAMVVVELARNSVVSSTSIESNSSTALAVDNDTAYIGTWDNSFDLKTVQLSTREVGSVGGISHPTAITLSGNKAYVATFTGSVDRPRAQHDLKTVDPETGDIQVVPGSLGNGQAVAVGPGNIAYIAAPAGLYSWNLTTGREGFLPPPAIGNSRGMVLSGNTLYLATSMMADDNDITTKDLKILSLDSLTGLVNRIVDVSGIHGASHLALANNKVYISTVYDGLNIVDLADGNRVTNMGIDFSSAGPIAIADNKAYVGTSDGIKVLDLANLNEVVATIGVSGAEAIATFENKLYVARGDSGANSLQIVDLAKDNSVSSLEGVKMANAVTVDPVNKRLYIGTSRNLLIYSIGGAPQP